MNPAKENPIEGDTSKPAFTFPEDGDRPLIDEYPTKPKFQLGEQVYLRVHGTTTREGPYTASPHEPGWYKLCDKSGSAINNGALFKEEDLELYDPFDI